MAEKTCKLCNKIFDQIGVDKTCDNCWEVLHRIRMMNKELIQLILYEAGWINTLNKRS